MMFILVRVKEPKNGEGRDHLFYKTHIYIYIMIVIAQEGKYSKILPDGI